MMTKTRMKKESLDSMLRQSSSPEGPDPSEKEV